MISLSYPKPRTPHRSNSEKISCDLILEICVEETGKIRWFLPGLEEATKPTLAVLRFVLHEPGKRLVPSDDGNFLAPLACARSRERCVFAS
jgi:hypothetical protein